MGEIKHCVKVLCVTRVTHGFVSFKGDLELQVVPGGQDVAKRRLVRSEAAISGLKKSFLFTFSHEVYL